MDTLGGVFIFMAIGIGLALLILAIEILWDRHVKVGHGLAIPSRCSMGKS
jgi:hypothetical protein